MILNGKEISAIRLGTSGGIGLTPGTVVVTEQAVDGRLQPYLETVTLPIPNIFEKYYLSDNSRQCGFKRGKAGP